MELENNNKIKPKKHFLHHEEEYVDRKPVFKSYKTFYPNEMEGETKFMNNNPPPFLDVILKILISPSAIIVILFVGSYGARILHPSSKFGSPSVSQLLALIMAAIVGPTILIFILFVVYKQISQFRLFKNLNKSLERRSIKFNNLSNHAVEIVF
ncbi:hypothetical protein DDB_G0286081 [Dictyostelium discoideum AX4]|uniref:Transmembrane protein n=1 Tax=Dictyostelium discoideum TaxID=44689 RepID=Q54MA3_DICDI|nr:hypothetical protein DDB_G0286081 [Dictyostelium discoideum AX4]EAL64419.1 hypothetical protein DDB_G0286081 [Dictyostelium discoideum AX4]|eukprot:XP_637931.1 hypothetical protein DDB_G0286081 [Dictyostelium discoideum AX4]